MELPFVTKPFNVIPYLESDVEKIIEKTGFDNRAIIERVLRSHGGEYYEALKEIWEIKTGGKVKS